MAAVARKEAAARKPAEKRLTKPKMLVFMAISSRALLDPARAAREALEDDFRKLDAAGKLDVHVLLHGFRLGADDDPSVETLEIGGQPSDYNGRRYLPGDTGVLREWLKDELGGPGDAPTLLVIWGHGQGVGGLLQAAGDDENRPTLLDIGGLPERDVALAIDAALPEGRKPYDTGEPGRAPRKARLDLLVLDSCLMAGVELAFEFRNVARYLVASQTLVEFPGLNLGSVLRQFHDAVKPKTKPEDVGLIAGRGIVNLVGESLSGAQQLTLFNLGPLYSPQADLDSALGDVSLGIIRLMHLIEKQCGPRAGNDDVAALDITGGLQRFAKSAGLPLLVWLWAFTQLLRWAMADGRERRRLVRAFERASYGPVRQFLDLGNLARQVHRYSRFGPLQSAGLEVAKRLREAKPNGAEPPGDEQTTFVVRWRASLKLEDKRRFSGVSIYCPWFEAAPARPGAAAVYDVLVDHDNYRSLALPAALRWSDLVLGTMYELTTGARTQQRSTSRTADRQHELFLRLMARVLRDTHGGGAGGCGDVSGGGGGGGGFLGEPKPSGGNLADAEPKPSGGNLADFDDV